MMKKLKSFASSRFLGRQLSRLKMAQSYYVIITSTVTAMSVLSLAFSVDFLFLVFIFPLLMVVTFIIGYFMDKRDVMTEDTLKANEMANRYLNTLDLKSQEFQIIQTEILLDALNSLQNDKPIDKDSLKKRYSDYVAKWSTKQKIIDKV